MTTNFNFRKFRNAWIKTAPAILTLVIAFSACGTKTIDVPLKNAAAQLVIEGKILNTPGPYYVLLSNSMEVNAGNKYPAVSGAVVKITDKTMGKTEQLKDIGGGKYATTTTVGTPGHTYQLSVAIKGKTYTSVSTMPKAIKLMSVTFQKVSVIGAERIFAVSNYKDPTASENYYIFKEYINGVDRSGVTFAFDDQLTDGKNVSQSLFTDSAYIKTGDKVTIEMNCVDKKIYNYFNALMGVNSQQAATPANPVTNIAGKGNILGYFSAQTVSKTQGVAN